MNNLPAAAYDAMAVQAKRRQRPTTPDDIIADLRQRLEKAERDLAAAQVEINRLNIENEKLRASVVHSSRNTGEGVFVNGRRVVNQVEAAQILRVEQYQISRWVAAKKFQLAAVPGRKKPLIYADSLHKPERGQPGRKKK